MARVIGVDIPNDKRLEISLTYIFGVGRKTAKDVCRDLNLDPGMKAGPQRGAGHCAATHLQKNYRRGDRRSWRKPHPPSGHLLRGLRHRRPPRARSADPHQRPFAQGPKTVAGKKSIK